ncbi:MAG: ABC transporter permease [Gemmatimonadales bacterium]|nr:ABC transporter permease [Gemmatimonadales bacterium]
MHDAIRNVRYVARTLTRTPGVAAAAILCLGIGIATVTTIYSAASALVLHPVPVRDERGLVMLTETPPMGLDPDFHLLSATNYLDWVSQSPSIERAAAYQEIDINLTGTTGGSEFFYGFPVTPDFFTLLGQAPIRGRTFGAKDGVEGEPKTVILSYALWQRSFGADTGIVGRSARLNGVPHLVIGVMPKEFAFPVGAGLWLPLDFTGPLGKDRAIRRYQAIARLKPGATIEHARAEANAIAQRLSKDHVYENTGWGLHLAPAQEFYGRHLRPYLVLLLAAVGFVQLIACANVANLLIARVMARARDHAVRKALGARAMHVVNEVVTEGAIIATAGGTLGVLLALGGTRLLRVMLPPDLLRINAGWTQIGVDGHTLLVSLGISALTALIIGLIPALTSFRATPRQLLSTAGRSVVSAGGRRSVRSALVVGQLALALLLLVGTALTARTFTRLARADLGYRTDRALTVALNPPSELHPTRESVGILYGRLLDEVAAMPGVQGAALTTALPASWDEFKMRFYLEGQPRPQRTDPMPRHTYNMVSGGYFSTMGIPVLRGRLFTSDEEVGKRHVGLVSESLAKRYWGGLDAVGKRFLLFGDSSLVEIVGVVADVRVNPNRGADAVPPTLYLPFGDTGWRPRTLVIRTAGDPSAAGPALRKAIAAVDPELAPGFMTPLSKLVSASIARQRATAGLLGTFAVLALLLAAMGLYGVMAYSVAIRRREIGVQMALGASPGKVVGQVMRQGGTLIAAGLVVGLAGALALSKTLTSLLHETAPAEPGLLAAVSAVLVVVAFSALYLSARRAARVDPAIVLYE